MFSLAVTSAWKFWQLWSTRSTHRWQGDQQDRPISHEFASAVRPRLTDASESDLHKMRPATFAVLSWDMRLLSVRVSGLQNWPFHYWKTWSRFNTNNPFNRTGLRRYVNVARKLTGKSTRACHWKESKRYGLFNLPNGKEISTNE